VTPSQQEMALLEKAVASADGRKISFKSKKKSSGGDTMSSKSKRLSSYLRNLKKSGGGGIAGFVRNFGTVWKGRGIGRKVKGKYWRLAVHKRLLGYGKGERGKRDGKWDLNLIPRCKDLADVRC
jgi:hypothetical protein